MKKGKEEIYMKKLILSLFATTVLLFVTIIPFGVEGQHVYATSTTTSTTSTTFPATFRVTGAHARVHTSFLASSPVVRNLEINARIKVIGRATNWHGNIWFELSDGNWIYGGSVQRVTATSINALSRDTTTFRVTRDGARVRSGTYASASVVRRLQLNDRIAITGSLINSNGNKWYRLVSGDWIYSGNVQLEPWIQLSQMITFRVTRDGAPIRIGNYARTSIDRTLGLNAEIQVTAGIINSHGNKWYLVHGLGGWIYSGNVEQPPGIPPRIP